MIDLWKHVFPENPLPRRKARGKKVCVNIFETQKEETKLKLK